MTLSRSVRPLRSRLVAACLIPLAVLSGSCDGPTEARAPVHPAHGQVLYKGKPLPDALVVLRTADPAATKAGGLPQPTGRTNSEGKFQLHTYIGNDGAPAGSYLVGISVSPAFSETRDVMKEAVTPKPAPEVLGTRYVDPASSGLKAEIKPGENEIPPFKLN